MAPLSWSKARVGLGIFEEERRWLQKDHSILLRPPCQTSPSLPKLPISLQELIEINAAKTRKLHPTLTTQSALLIWQRRLEALPTSLSFKYELNPNFATSTRIYLVLAPKKPCRSAV